MFLRLLASIGLNTTNLEVGFKRAESAATKFSNNLNSNLKSQLASAFGATAMAMAAKNAVDYGSKIKDLSDNLGISSRNLQIMDFAAKTSGATLEDFTGMLGKITDARQNALTDPNGKEAQSFAKLSISIDDLRTKRADEILFKVSSRMKELGDPALFAAEAVDVLGKSSRTAMGAMVEGLDEAGESAEKMGVILAENVTTALANVGDQIDLLQIRLNSLAGESLPFLLRAFERTFSFIRATIGATSAFIGSISSGLGYSKDKKSINLDEALKASLAAYDEVYKQRDEQDAAFQKRVEERKKRIQSFGNLNFEAFNKMDTVTSTQKDSENKLQLISGTLTENQRAGAFTNAIALSEQKKANDHLSNIRGDIHAIRVGGFRGAQPSQVTIFE